MNETSDFKDLLKTMSKRFRLSDTTDVFGEISIVAALSLQNPRQLMDLVMESEEKNMTM